MELEKEVAYLRRRIEEDQKRYDALVELYRQAQRELDSAAHGYAYACENCGACVSGDYSDEEFLDDDDE